MLVSCISYADDINIFLRNKWDNELEGGSDETKTQVLFLADRIIGAEAGSCTPTPVDLTQQCDTGAGEDCYTISVTVSSPSNGKVYLADETTDITAGGTWKAEKGNPGLFKVVPDEDYIAEYSGTCGVGSSYPNYYMTDHTKKEDCELIITFVSGTPDQVCDARPTTPAECTALQGTWKDGECEFVTETETVVPTDESECEGLGGFFTGDSAGDDLMQLHNIAVAPSYNGGNAMPIGACILPQAEGGSGGGVVDTLHFCNPPKFQSCEATAAEAGMDYRSVIAKVMQERPDIKYGLYAVDGSGATKVFPVAARDRATVDSVITNNLFNDTLFKDVDTDSITTLSALSDVYNYLQNGDNGDASPLTNKCAHTQLVILASGGHSGDDNKHKETFALSTDAVAYKPGIDSSYANLLEGAAEYLNNDEGEQELPEDRHNLKENCTARVTTHLIGVNPVDNSELFTTSLGQDMASKGGGIYKKLTLTSNSNEAKEELGTDLFNTILGIVDHSRQDTTALISPVAPVSITRGHHINNLYVPTFKPQEGVNWAGNITAGTTSAIPTPSFDDAATFISFKANRKIYTLNNSGDIVELESDGEGDDVFNPQDLAWLKKLGKDATPDTFGKADRRELLGDILHFRPLPIHIGDQAGAGNTDGTVDDNELFVVVGTNRGLLHVFNKAGLEQWAFLPPQLKPMVKALRKKNIAPTYNMVNHFYGVDGAPSVFIYDAGKDGKINPDDKVIAANKDDMIMLYFGLRRGGAGYFALDITRPASEPTAKWNIGDSDLTYGESHQVAVNAIKAGEPEQNANRITTPVTNQDISSGGSAGVCNEMISTQGAYSTNQTQGLQCANAPSPESGKSCDTWLAENRGVTVTLPHNEYCLLGTCDKVSAAIAGAYAVKPYLSNGLSADHRVLETVSATYIGKTADGTPAWTSKRLCVPVISVGENSIDFKPEAALQYSTVWDTANTNQTCFVQGVNQWNYGYSKGKLSVGNGTDSEHPGRLSAIIGFNITPLAELIKSGDIKITSATISLGHTKYEDGTYDFENEDGETETITTYADKKDYGTGVSVYAAKNGAFGEHPWQEGGTGIGDGLIDCQAMENIATDSVSINSGSAIATLTAPAAGSNRTTGGTIVSAALNELFSLSNMYKSVVEGSDYKVEADGTITITGGTFTQDNYYIQFGLRHDQAVSWGMIRESAALANHLNLAKYPNGDFYEQVSPNLNVKWCWLDNEGKCEGEEPDSPTLQIAITGSGSVDVQKDGETVDTCTVSNTSCSPIEYAEGDVLTLTAADVEGSSFSSWSGDCDSIADNVCTYTIESGANEVTATYTVQSYQLNATPDGVSVSEAGIIAAHLSYTENMFEGNTAVGATIPYNAEVTLTALVPEGKVISEWSGQPAEAEGCGANSTTCSFAMPAAITDVVVTYGDATTYSLTVNNAANGTVMINGTPCAESSCVKTEEGAYEVVFTPNTADGYEIGSIAGCSAKDSCTINVTLNESNTTEVLSASFVKKSYVVTLNAGTGGSVGVQSPVEHGTQSTITVTAIGDYTIAGLTGTASCNGITKQSGDDKNATYLTGAITDASCVVTVEFVTAGSSCDPISPPRTCSSLFYPYPELTKTRNVTPLDSCSYTDSSPTLPTYGWLEFTCSDERTGESCVFKYGKYSGTISDASGARNDEYTHQKDGKYYKSDSCGQ